jgi:hypothetical protein
VSDPARMQLAGAILHGLVTGLEEKFGRDLVWDTVRTLAPEHRSDCIDAATARVVHVDSSVALFRAIGERTGCDVRAVHAEIARKTAEKAFTTLWRVLLHFTSGEAIIARVPLIFSKSYPGIQVDGEMLEAGRATATVRNWPNIDELSFEGIGSAIEVVLGISGREEVRVQRERVRGLVVYSVRWKV